MASSVMCFMDHQPAMHPTAARAITMNLFRTLKSMMRSIMGALALFQEPMSNSSGRLFQPRAARRGCGRLEPSGRQLVLQGLALGRRRVARHRSQVLGARGMGRCLGGPPPNHPHCPGRRPLAVSCLSRRALPLAEPAASSQPVPFPAASPPSPAPGPSRRISRERGVVAAFRSRAEGGHPHPALGVDEEVARDRDPFPGREARRQSRPARPGSSPFGPGGARRCPRPFQRRRWPSFPYRSRPRPARGRIPAA